MEEQYVKNIYDEIGKYFNKTRAYLWNGIKNFVESLKKDSLVLDIGCGNGKNMLIRNDCVFIGIDNSKTLIEICKEKGLNVILADMRVLPFNDNKFDHLISVASFHHIEKEEDRIKTFKVLLQIGYTSNSTLILMPITYIDLCICFSQ